MTRAWLSILLIAVCSTGCHQPTPEEKAASAFTVNNLQANDGNSLTGCITTATRAGKTDGSRIFIEDSLQGGAHGFIRIDNVLLPLIMTTGGSDQIHSVRSFIDSSGKLSVVESYDIGETREGQIVRPLTGEMIVTWKGVTQRIPIGGARACISAP